MIKKLIKKIGNLSSDVIYITDNANWAIQSIGDYLSHNLAKSNIKFTQDTSFFGYQKKLIHFGSPEFYLPNSWKKISNANINIYTFFHGDDNDIEYNKSLKIAQERASLVHTSCDITKKHLINYGVPEEKIVIIPIGVDCKLFKPINNEEKKNRKKLHNIDEKYFVIGSFQKDGIGWREGNDPKLIKGPDIFCDVAEKLAKDHPIFVVLTGPARGYVKSRLENAGIPYIHNYLNDFKDVAYYYGLLDCYIISSRLEGGPMASLESQASGIPLVSTNVGMVPDICSDKENILLCSTFNSDEIAEKVKLLINDKNLYNNIREAALLNAQKYDWYNISKMYLEKLYLPLLER